MLGHRDYPPNVILSRSKQRIISKEKYQSKHKLIKVYLKKSIIFGVFSVKDNLSSQLKGRCSTEAQSSGAHSHFTLGLPSIEKSKFEIQWD